MDFLLVETLLRSVQGVREQIGETELLELGGDDLAQFAAVVDQLRRERDGSRLVSLGDTEVARNRPAHALIAFAAARRAGKDEEGRSRCRALGEALELAYFEGQKPTTYFAILTPVVLAVECLREADALESIAALKERLRSGRR